MLLSRQEEIKNWFNNTYSTRGNSYLRPKSAYFILLNHLKPIKGKYLDVACGLGRMLSCIESKDLETFGIDLSEVAIEKAKVNVPRAKLSVGNAESLPYPDNYFDYISCIGSLERMLNLERVLQEKQRVAKQDASFCFMVRNSRNFTWRIKEFFKLKNNNGHQTAKDLDQWIEIFEQFGFEIKGIFPDQWILHRIVQIFSFGIISPSPKRKFPRLLPLSLSHEFIFILKNNG
jgi:ubiquinone/menaquinone biosynthesis C-methylase UbiE